MTALIWSVWGYPDGAYNERETDVGTHNVIGNFDLGVDP